MWFQKNLEIQTQVVQQQIKILMEVFKENLMKNSMI